MTDNQHEKKNESSKSFTFAGKKFFLHFTHSRSKKMVEFIKQFGGQIEQFLDHEISYLLTDIPRSEWPPKGGDILLVRATQYNVKLMALDDLIKFCKSYVSSQSSGDDDDDNGLSVRALKHPFIKHEDSACRFAPSVREFVKWPEINIDQPLTVGKSFFSDPSFLITPTHSANNINHLNHSAQLTQLASRKTPNPSTAANQPPINVNSNNMNVVATRILNAAANNSIARNSTQHNNCPRLGVKRRHSIYCEVCNLKVDERIEDHCQTQAHKLNVDKMNWSDVEAVLASLPSISTLNKQRLTDMRPQDGAESSEFLCLHKVDSASPLFPSSDMPIQHWVTRTDGTRIRLS